MEVEQNLGILLGAANNLKRQRELHTQASHAFTKIGEIMQKIHNLDHIKINMSSPNHISEAEFYSDKPLDILDLDDQPQHNSKKPGSFKDDYQSKPQLATLEDYDHLD